MHSDLDTGSSSGGRRKIRTTSRVSIPDFELELSRRPVRVSSQLTDHISSARCVLLPFIFIGRYGFHTIADAILSCNRIEISPSRLRLPLLVVKQLPCLAAVKEMDKLREICRIWSLIWCYFAYRSILRAGMVACLLYVFLFARVFCR